MTPKEFKVQMVKIMMMGLALVLGTIWALNMLWSLREIVTIVGK